MSSHQIAKIYHCHQSTIWYRLKRYRIKMRTGSGAKRLVFKINISKEKLKKLYLGSKMSSLEIAKIYHCSPNSIRCLLRKYKIRIRPKSEARRLFYNINIPKKELKEMYLEKKISSVEIAKRFKCNPGLVRNRLREYKIPIRSIQKALPLSNTPEYPRLILAGI